MAERVDEKGHVLDRRHPGDSGEQKATQRARPARVPKAQERREHEADPHGDRHVETILPHEEPVLAQILNVVERRLGIEFEQNPAHVRIPETLGNIVGVEFAVHMLVVPAMVGDPVHRTVLESGRAKNQRDQPHRPTGLERHMRKQPVVAQRDAQAGRDEKNQEQEDLKQIHAKKPQIHGHGGAGCHEGANQERTVGPIDPGGGETKWHGRLACGSRGAGREEFVE